MIPKNASALRKELRNKKGLDATSEVAESLLKLLRNRSFTSESDMWLFLACQANRLGCRFVSRAKDESMSGNGNPARSKIFHSAHKKPKPVNGQAVGEFRRA